MTLAYKGGWWFNKQQANFDPRVICVKFPVSLFLLRYLQPTTTEFRQRTYKEIFSNVFRQSCAICTSDRVVEHWPSAHATVMSAVFTSSGTCANCYNIAGTSNRLSAKRRTQMEDVTRLYLGGEGICQIGLCRFMCALCQCKIGLCATAD
jgi:hypothetical protein